MPLPQMDNFEALLDSITPEKPAGDRPWKEVVAVPTKTGKDHGGFVALPVVGFWYLESENLSFESFVRRVTTDLDRLGHSARPEIVLVILGIFARTRRSPRSSVEQFNLLFEHVVTADLNQYIAFSAPPPAGFQFNVGDFTVGKFNSQRLSYQCRKAGSDFFDRFEKDLSQLPLSIERKHFSVKTIHWNRLAGLKDGWSIKATGYIDAMTRLRDHFYALLAAVYLEDFFRRMRLAQEVGIALGSDWFDPEPLTRMVGAQFISVFLDIGSDKRGYVSGGGIGALGFQLGGTHLGMPATEKLLREQFGFEGFKNCEIHQTIKTFCHFLALAESHHGERRHAEGFLHHVIALDLLLGEKNASTQNVSKRSAVLTHEPRKISFNNAVAESEAIYDARSKYVHTGKEPEERLWGIVRSICREVVFCLFRLQPAPANHADGFRDRWLKDVDLVIATIQANRAVLDSDLQRIGITQEKDFKQASFLALLKDAKRLREFLGQS
jgi:Apea-like HEPN